MAGKIGKRAKQIIITMVLAALTAISGCAKQSGQDQDEERYVTIKGSDTMVHLVSNWAESFMRHSPGTEVSVTGGGSGTGIAALLNGTTDICAASREIRAKESKLAVQKGIQPNEIVVARDGIAVVVNPDNPVGELTTEQLSRIFTGRSRRWSAVGGPDEEIIVLSRESSSGTYVFFQQHVLNKQDFMQGAKLLPATSAIIQAVSTDRWAIGYVGLGYAVGAEDRVKIIAVKADDPSPAVVPSAETIRSAQYPIAWPLYLYVNGQPRGTVKQFVDFCLSGDGQEIVEQTGYVAVQ